MNNRDIPCRKAIYFDLDMQLLDEHYCKPFGLSRATAYDKIRSFMKENGFEHRQGSGYHSLEPLTSSKAQLLLVDLGKQFSWLSKCVKEMDVTDIGETYSVKSFLDNSNNAAVDREQETSNANGKYEYIKASCKGETTLLVSDPRNIAAYIMHHPTDSFVLRSPEGKTVLSTYGMMIDACNDMPFLKSIVSEIEPMQARHQKPNIKLYASKDLHINSALSRSI